MTLTYRQPPHLNLGKHNTMVSCTFVVGYNEHPNKTKVRSSNLCLKQFTKAWKKQPIAWKKLLYKHADVRCKCLKIYNF